MEDPNIPIKNLKKKVKYFDLKKKHKQALFFVQEGHHKLLCNLLFQSRSINFKVIRQIKKLDL